MQLYKALLSIALLSTASFGHASIEPFERSKNTLPPDAGDGAAPKEEGSEHPHPRDHLDAHHHLDDAADETGRLLLRGNSGGDTKDDADIAALSERRLQENCTCTPLPNPGAPEPFDGCSLCLNDGTNIVCPDPPEFALADNAGAEAVIRGCDFVECNGNTFPGVCIEAILIVPPGGLVFCIGLPGIDPPACADASVSFFGGGGDLGCSNGACAGSGGGSIRVPDGGSLSCTFNSVPPPVCYNDTYVNFRIGFLDELAFSAAAGGGTFTCTAYVTPDCTPPASIGDFVWQDLNANGIQDDGEPGAEAVTVNLYDCNDNQLASTTTDVNGDYGFSDLTPGDYYVEFVLPTGYVFSPRDQGGDDSRDSDADPDTGKTICTTLESRENDPTWDAGMRSYSPASLGDFVWEDLNANGIQDPNEVGVGVAGVTVNLYDCDDNQLASTTTDGSGVYGFSDLTPGDYYVEFVLPTGYVFSPRDQGGDDSRDSDADPDTGKTICTTLESGENDPTWDAGMRSYSPASLGDFVWEDLDGDGIQDAGEPGLLGVTVNLYDCDDNQLASTTTDGSGDYGFSGLTPGDYYVEFVLPTGYVFSPQNLGGDDSIDSDADFSTGITACTTLTSGENDPTIDAGMYNRPASLGDFVWEDLNANGIQDNGEPGVAAVTVNLYDCNDNLFASTTTDGSGVYGFSGLTPGDYYVEFVLPTGYVFSPQDLGDNNSIDSDADPGTGKTICTTLESGENDPTIDAGMYSRPASLGDFVWEDLDGDGIQDPNEVGVAGVTVNLYDCDDNLFASTTTDGSGVYGFSGLTPGDYYVEFVLPTGYVFSPQDQGGDDSIDSDADFSTGLTACTTLESGENDPTIDAGMYMSSGTKSSKGPKSAKSKSPKMTKFPKRRKMSYV